VGGAYLAVATGVDHPGATTRGLENALAARQRCAQPEKWNRRRRDEKPMNRYFPELIAPLAATLSERCVVDGEIVIVGVGGAVTAISIRRRVR